MGSREELWLDAQYTLEFGLWKRHSSSKGPTCFGICHESMGKCVCVCVFSFVLGVNLCYDLRSSISSLNELMSYCFSQASGPPGLFRNVLVQVTPRRLKGGGWGKDRGERMSCERSYVPPVLNFPAPFEPETVPKNPYHGCQFER